MPASRTAQEMERKLVLMVFDSTNAALMTERALKGAGVPNTVVPTPLEVTADCGISLLVDETQLEAALRALGDNGIDEYRLISPYEHPHRSPGGSGGA